MNKKRLENLVISMRKENIDAIALNPGHSMRYLTNLDFHLMERPTVLIITSDGNSHFILPQLEASRALKYFSVDQITTYSDNPALWANAFKIALDKLNLGTCKIGIESTRFRFLELQILQEASPECNIIAADQVFSDFRIIKDQNEINNMRKAAIIAQNALQETLKEPVVGKTEREIASLLTINLLKQGSGEFPFPPIVAAGKNSANPHATPTDHIISTGELLLFDWGASFDGYASDITRTFAVGEVDPIYHQIASIVEQANKNGRLASKPGVSAGSIDHVTRDTIVDEGFGEYFTHRTGHGLGMDAHETPYIYAENSQLLREGMVFTIEPGIYLPEKGGVRIEDNIAITNDGSISLTDLPRQLIQIK